MSVSESYAIVCERLLEWDSCRIILGLFGWQYGVMEVVGWRNIFRVLPHVAPRPRKFIATDCSAEHEKQ